MKIRKNIPATFSLQQKCDFVFKGESIPLAWVFLHAAPKGTFIRMIGWLKQEKPEKSGLCIIFFSNTRFFVN